MTYESTLSGPHFDLSNADKLPPGTCSMKILKNPSSETDPRYWTMFLWLSREWSLISSCKGWTSPPRDFNGISFTAMRTWAFEILSSFVTCARLQAWKCYRYSYFFTRLLFLPDCLYSWRHRRSREFLFPERVAANRQSPHVHIQIADNRCTSPNQGHVPWKKIKRKSWTQLEEDKKMLKYWRTMIKVAFIQTRFSLSAVIESTSS